MFSVVKKSVFAGLLAAFLLGLSVEGAKCTRPAVRKEWRKLSVHERKDWIRAVNVGNIFFCRWKLTNSTC